MSSDYIASSAAYNGVLPVGSTRFHQYSIT
jgi:hypothetical protein